MAAQGTGGPALLRAPCCGPGLGLRSPSMISSFTLWSSRTTSSRISCGEQSLRGKGQAAEVQSALDPGSQPRPYPCPHPHERSVPSSSRRQATLAGPAASFTPESLFWRRQGWGPKLVPPPPPPAGSWTCGPHGTCPARRLRHVSGLWLLPSLAERAPSPVSSGPNLRHPGPRRLHFPPASSWGAGDGRVR